MTELQETLKSLEPETLDLVHQRLLLVGVVLAQIRMLEVVADIHASDNAAVQAAKVLTNVGMDPHVLAERLKASALASKSPDQLRELVKSLRSKDTLEDLAREEA